MARTRRAPFLFRDPACVYCSRWQILEKIKGTISLEQNLNHRNQVPSMSKLLVRPGSLYTSSRLPVPSPLAAVKGAASFMAWRGEKVREGTRWVWRVGNDREGRKVRKEGGKEERDWISCALLSQLNSWIRHVIRTAPDVMQYWGRVQCSHSCTNQRHWLRIELLCTKCVQSGLIRSSLSVAIQQRTRTKTWLNKPKILVNYINPNLIYLTLYGRGVLPFRIIPVRLLNGIWYFSTQVFLTPYVY